MENLNVRKVGHQEIILEGVDLLKHLHYDFASETLQTQALRLGCRARSLYNQLKTEDCDLNPSRVSTSTLSCVSDILLSVKSFISWIDRYPFSAQDTYLPVRECILRRSIELASTAQRDQFVEKPNEVLKDSCSGIATLCDKIVQELNDSLAITPASLEGNATLSIPLFIPLSLPVTSDLQTFFPSIHPFNSCGDQKEIRRGLGTANLFILLWGAFSWRNSRPKPIIEMFTDRRR